MGEGLRAEASPSSLLDQHAKDYDKLWSQHSYMITNNTNTYNYLIAGCALIKGPDSGVQDRDTLMELSPNYSNKTFSKTKFENCSNVHT